MALRNPPCTTTVGQNSAFKTLQGLNKPLFLTDQVTEDVKPQEKEEEKGTTLSPVGPVIPPEKYPHVQRNTKSKPRHSYKTTRTKAKQHITKDIDKESRHPFAMYGSGERQADMASKRTHNVGPAASTKEVSITWQKNINISVLVKNVLL